MEKDKVFSIGAFKQWEVEFRRESKADRYSIFRKHLRKFDLPARPKLLLEGTISAVQACLIYSMLDNRLSQFQKFLAIQRYDPEEINEDYYAFTFNLRELSYARLLVSPMFEVIDLADLLNHPWVQLRTIGYNCFWVSRIDGNPLSHVELLEIEERVTEDLRFDYPEEELVFWFDYTTYEGSVCVNVQEIYDVENEDDDE